MSKKSPREYHLQRKYGINLSDYARILKSQKGNCAVCKRPASVFKVNLAVDHDHKTGEIFGLLCTYCNRRVIGRERRWELFENASIYLKKGLGLFIPSKKPKRKRTKRKSRKK